MKIATAGFFREQAGFIFGLSAPLAFGDHFFRAKNFDDFLFDTLAAGNHPEDLLFNDLTLTPGFLFTTVVIGFVVFSDGDLKVDIALEAFAAVEKQAALKEPGIQESVRRKRLPDLFKGFPEDQVGSARFGFRPAR